MLQESGWADPVASADEDIVDESSVVGLAVSDIDHGLGAVIEDDGVELQMVARDVGVRKGMVAIEESVFSDQVQVINGTNWKRIELTWSSHPVQI